jgi:hypothetical protein
MEQAHYKHQIIDLNGLAMKTASPQIVLISQIRILLKELHYHHRASEHSLLITINQLSKMKLNKKQRLDLLIKCSKELLREEQLKKTKRRMK